MNAIEKMTDLLRLEQAMLAREQVECPVDHHFSKGLYVRTMFAPAGTLIMGKRHRQETCNMLIQGNLLIYAGPDEPPILFKAPCVFNSLPGAKKLGYAVTDVIFSNIHPTEETDLEKIEAEFIITAGEYLEANVRAELCLG